MDNPSLHHQQMRRRLARTRAHLAGNQSVPRLSVHRTLRHIWAQVIDDTTSKTLLSASDSSIKATGTKTEVAKAVGIKIAELATAQKISAVRFDRGASRYQGRVAALAEAAREAGLQF